MYVLKAENGALDCCIAKDEIAIWKSRKKFFLNSIASDYLYGLISFILGDSVYLGKEEGQGKNILSVPPV